MLAAFSFQLKDPVAIFLCGITILILFFWYFATDIERRKRNVGTALTILVAALCLMAVIPPKERLKGGIDIVGGSSFSLHVQPREDDNGVKMPVTTSQVEKAIEILEKRLNSMGIAEPLITRVGEAGIDIQMPGITPEEAPTVRESLEKIAKLEFREVSPRNEESVPGGKSLAQAVMDKEERVVGYAAYMQKQKNADGVETSFPILLNRRPALGGSDVSNASPSMQQADAVDITLNGKGEDKMIALTKNMTPGTSRIAVVLDGEVISAPVVNQVPLGKRFIIEGLRDPGEPTALANSLMNPLENPLVIDDMRNISPTLGAAIVKQGLMAGGLALLFTFLFAVIYYRVSGIIAVIGLTLNTVMLFGAMALFGFTFSLPGIAGMILTVGMAVDANVLIYERLREELAHGKSTKSAIDAAYEKAFSAIFDSNVTSLITAIILFTLGSGTIKGFAITLTIGLTASLFSAILVTRVLFRWGVDLGILRKFSFMNLIRSKDFNFLRHRKTAISLAIITLLIAIGAIAVRKDKALGVDFVGGTKYTYQLGETEVSMKQVDAALATMQLSKTAYPQIESNPASGASLIVRCATADAEKIDTTLRTQIPALGEKVDGKYKIEASLEQVSPVIGGTFLKKSLIAIALGLAGIVAYMTMRFEFSFALAGFVAIFHDIIICTGLCILLGRELTLIHVSAILTIAGYSINDTIIVFDRIREMLLVDKHEPLEKTMNDAINATLSRTILTSSATLISVALLTFLGGSSLYDFGLYIFIGIVVGTFSSIFIASPIVLWWSGRKGGNLREQVRATEAAAQAAAEAP